jgi:hypothetical protein
MLGTAIVSFLIPGPSWTAGVGFGEAEGPAVLVWCDSPRRTKWRRRVSGLPNPLWADTEAMVSLPRSRRHAASRTRCRFTHQCPVSGSSDQGPQPAVCHEPGGRRLLVARAAR